MCIGIISIRNMHLVSHVRLELKFGRWAESCGKHLHKPLPVTSEVQAVHCILNDVEPLMTRRLKVVLSGQVSPQSSIQTGVVP